MVVPKINKKKKKKKKKNRTAPQQQEPRMSDPRMSDPPAAANGQVPEVPDASRCPVLPAESDDGPVEYKRQLTAPTAARLAHLVTQLNFRVGEGGGEALYELGIEDNGLPVGISDADMDASIATLERMAAAIGCEVTLLRRRAGDVGVVAELLVRTVPSPEAAFTEVRVASLGNVDAGKSTLLGVLSRGVLDNGRGRARAVLFRHKHELETGRTSAISHELMAFRGTEVVGYGALRTPTWAELTAQAGKVINFVDLAGHERYLKTTAFGLTGLAPDFGMLVVGANHGVIGMSKEHMGIALALKLPIFAVINKIDMAPPNVFEESMRQVKKMLKAPGSRKLPVVIRSEEDVLVAIRNFGDGANNVAPIFTVSCVTGASLDLLRMFLNLLPVRRRAFPGASGGSAGAAGGSSATGRPMFQIDDSFTTAVGTVVSGTCRSGRFAVGHAPLVIGPDGNGAWQPITIRSIHCHRTPVGSVHAGQSASFAVHKKVKRAAVRKGMVVVSPEDAFCAAHFQAEILVLHHATSIQVGYEAVVHVSCVRQCARVIAIHADADDAGACATDGAAAGADADPLRRLALPAGEPEGPCSARRGMRRDADGNPDAKMLRAGDKAFVTFAFLYRPEHIHPGERFIFREGRSRGIGRITRVRPFVSRTAGGGGAALGSSAASAAGGASTSTSTSTSSHGRKR
jgi:GTPase